MGRGADEPNSESAQRREPELSVPRLRLLQRFTLIESNYPFSLGQADRSDDRVLARVDLNGGRRGAF